MSALFWLINKSGLPLVFKQDGTSKEAAGQFSEHEIARSVAPLLFSFADSEYPSQCTMRIGKDQHKDSTPNWCQSFPLEAGIGVRQLHVVSSEVSCPHWVYIIGIDVRAGRGRYRDTKMVTFAPRYQLDNQSSHKLKFAQRYALYGEGHDCHLSAMPKSSLAFHWPRLDMKQLLCVCDCNLPGACFTTSAINRQHKILLYLLYLLYSYLSHTWGRQVFIIKTMLTSIHSLQFTVTTIYYRLVSYHIYHILTTIWYPDVFLSLGHV